MGAYYDDDNGTNSGSAYIFKRIGTEWIRQAKLTPSDGAASGYFGYSVSISGDYALVGAYKDDGNGTDSGSAYIYLNFTTVDTDNDGLMDNIEAILGANPNDADSDDDGITDGDEDVNHNGKVDDGETDPCDIDSDDDGIQDGTEKGVTEPIADPDGDGPLLGTDITLFQPDLDPLSVTDSLDTDTDGDDFSDGEEDANHNGRIDVGEMNPNAVNPRIISIEPPFGWFGDQVTINGSNFDEQQGTGYVTFHNGIHAGNVDSWSDNQILVFVPNGTQTGCVVVTVDLQMSNCVNFSVKLFGDVNGDATVNLTDAIISMQVITGIVPSEPLNMDADVNGDRKIGIAEVAYILQILSGF